jgi:rubrerythrin
MRYRGEQEPWPCSLCDKKNPMPGEKLALTVYLSEMRAMELYEKMESESSGEAKKMFREIKEMEKGHMDSAKKRYMDLREHTVGLHAF